MNFHGPPVRLIVNALNNHNRVIGLKKIAPRRFLSRTQRVVRRRFSLLCLLLAWLCANGAVWNVVQVVAWTKMFHQYSQVMPVVQALKITFDGSAPCDLCVVVQTAEDRAGKQLPQAAALGASDKLVLACETSTPLVNVEISAGWPGVAHDAGLTRTERVPVPPPRV
jgi:hypothetical protein